MNESTNNPTEFDRGFAEAERQLRPEIEQRNKELNQQIERTVVYINHIERAMEFLREAYAGTTAGEMTQLMEEIAEKLGEKLDRVVTVRVQAEWHIDVRLPAGIEPWQVDSLDVDVPEPSISSGFETLEIWACYEQDVTIDEI